MKIDEKIKDERMLYDNNTHAANILAWSLGKIDKYQCFTVEEIFSFDQSGIIEQATFMYSRLGKAFKNRWKRLNIKE